MEVSNSGRQTKPPLQCRPHSYEPGRSILPPSHRARAYTLFPHRCFSGARRRVNRACITGVKCAQRPRSGRADHRGVSYRRAAVTRTGLFMLSGSARPSPSISLAARRLIRTVSLCAAILLASAPPTALALQATPAASNQSSAEEARLAVMAEKALALQKSGDADGARTVMQNLVGERKTLSGIDAPPCRGGNLCDRRKDRQGAAGTARDHRQKARRRQHRPVTHRKRGLLFHHADACGMAAGPRWPANATWCSAQALAMLRKRLPRSTASAAPSRQRP